MCLQFHVHRVSLVSWRLLETECKCLVFGILNVTSEKARMCSSTTSQPVAEGILCGIYLGNSTMEDLNRQKSRILPLFVFSTRRKNVW